MFKLAKQVGIPSFAGLLLYASFRTGFWALAILAIAVFYRTLVDQPGRTRFIAALAFATSFFASLVLWVSVIGLDALLLLSGLCIIFFLLVAWLPIASGSLWNKIEFALIWVLVELLRSNYPWGGFSWGLIGYSQTTGPLVEYARFGSTSLVTFTTVLLATIFADRKFLTVKSHQILAISLIAIAYVIPASETSGEIRVGIVQGGVVSDFVPEFAKPEQVFVKHLQQTKMHAEILRTADVVVWPENSVNLQSSSSETELQIQQIVDYIGKPFLIGAVRQTIEGQPQNIVTLWLPKTGASTSYVKNHLVPFGEYLPLRHQLAPHIDRFDQIPADFEPGQGGGVIEVAQTKVGVAICFEVADQRHLTRLVNDDAQIFIAASNNATYLNSQQPAQQFEISRFSAIAHQRTMVVATTSGVSGVISPSGKVSNRVDSSDGLVFVADVALATNRTFSDRFPLLPYYLVGVLAAVMGQRRLLVRMEQKQTKQSVN